MAKAKYTYELALGLGAIGLVGGAIYGVHWEKQYQRKIMHRAVIHDRLQEQKELEQRQLQEQQEPEQLEAASTFSNRD